MADETKKSYPVLSVRSWRELRRKFDQKIPTVVDGSYIGTALSMNARSAQTNILPSLKMLGLIDDDGKPKDLAKRWRDDKEYPKVCKEMLESIYPTSLLDAAPDPSEKREDVKRWFKHETGAGDSAAGKMTAVFTLLQEADVEALKKEDIIKKPVETKAGKKTGSADKIKEKPASTLPEAGDEIAGQMPEIHIDVQIHVSADSTPDQIDHLFASMAKHLKEFAIKKAK